MTARTSPAARGTASHSDRPSWVVGEGGHRHGCELSWLRRTGGLKRQGEEFDLTAESTSGATRNEILG